MDVALDTMFRPAPPGGEIETTRLFRHTPAKVWAALTIPARIADWMGAEWLGSDDALRPGSAMHLRFTDTDMESRGEVLRFEAPHVLEHSFFDNLPPGSVVCWVLSAEGEFCRLTLTHRFRATEDAPRHAAGWLGLLNRLGETLDGVAPSGGMDRWRFWRDAFAADFPAAATRDGRRIDVDGMPAIRFRRVLAHQPDVVWRALIEPAAMARWLQAEAAVDPRVGGCFQLVFQGGPDRMDGEITQFDPPSLLEYTWPESSAHGNSVVRFELRPDRDGCHLTLTHVLRAGGEMADFASGWHWHLDALDAALLGRGRAFDRERWAALRQVYEATL